MSRNEAIRVDNADLRVARLYRFYADVESRLNIQTNSTKATYNSPVNFIESLQKPRHRWFPYKEGFSPSFVRSFLQEFDEGASGVVFDPFVGSGTTGIVAGELGRSAIGIDVSPLTSFVARTKATTMTKRELSDFKSLIRDFTLSKLEHVSAAPDNETVKRYFEPDNLDAILRVKKYYAEIHSEKHRDLFKLAYLSAIEPFSTHRKAGNGVKRKTREEYPIGSVDVHQSLKTFLSKRLEVFAGDIEATSNFVVPEFRQGSCIDDTVLLNGDAISSLLTSPPYANCFDYSKIYMSELWLGDFFGATGDQKAFRDASVRSHVHAQWDERNEFLGSEIVDEVIRDHIEAQDLWSPRIGSMLSGYFKDLGKLLVAIKPKLQRGAHLGFVVGNSFYGGVAVATDLLLADLAAKHGYTVEAVRVYRGVIPSSQQYKLLGENRKYMRESLVIVRAN